MDCDVLIIGAGPAGLSAALVLGRCLRTVLVYNSGEPRNRSSQAMHCYLSRDGVDPKDFIAGSRRQLDVYETVSLHNGVAVSAEAIDGGFKVAFADGATRTSRKLLLATGVRDVLPKIDGLAGCYGRSVHHCPYCDGYEHRDQALAVIGDGEKGAGLARLMRQWSADVTLCANGDPVSAEHAQDLARAGVKVRLEKLRACEAKDGALERLIFADGPPLECSAVFFNTGQVQRSDLLSQLGCQFDDKGGVKTNHLEQTGVPGLYVAGDASRDLQFVVMAAAEGAKAAVAINAELLRES